MLASYATGLIAVVALAVGWVAVQSAWRRVFPAGGSDPDALAGRTGCHGCAGRPEGCERRPQGGRSESHE